jgi:hypothetical protein
VTCAAVRSLTMRPPRKAYPGASSTPVTDARVPALVPRRMSPLAQANLARRWCVRASAAMGTSPLTVRIDLDPR